MSDVLSSWKDVAAHLGKSVRTVQRWETELGLPIHRPDRRQQRIILAFPEELKRWMGGKQAAAGKNGDERRRRLEENKQRLRAQLQRLQSLSDTLQRETAATLNRAKRARSLARRASAGST